MTQQYDHGIGHKRKRAHDRYHQFSEYGDAENYRIEPEKMHDKLRK